MTRALVLSAALALAACDQSPPSAAAPLVIATFFPLVELTRPVAGSEARVVSLVPPGVEPHDWEPSPRDIARVRDARLFVFNGAGLEPWVPRLLAEAGIPASRIARATEGIALMAEPDRSADSSGSAVDPHVWLDPVLAETVVATIRTALAAADPSHAAVYAENARRFTARLEALDEAYRAGLAHCERREVVVSHAMLGYLARRYGLSVVPVMGLSPESEPSPARLAAIVRFARERKVKYIFSETLISPRLAETLAREVGAKTLAFNPIEGVTAEEAAAGLDYVSLMEENLRNLRLALDCR